MPLLVPGTGIIATSAILVYTTVQYSKTWQPAFAATTCILLIALIVFHK
jgi:hypothetical protein